MPSENESSRFNADYVTVYEGDAMKEVIDDHEERISTNEQFRLMAKGALIVISFILGSGFGLTIIAYMLGLI
ncbi:hypothetical protein M1M34_gp014 [Haloarcula tailed virus 2]|uniref:Uncharacterized protein n=1 Tax=Haloarcula tailed virus 2 TaxID=2877989 RepID=A0AAE8XZU0_9CAUD|nr:hypothetical protein M1M34_gp014 [Haloarcula tailed virus 2]UBF23165.1 hypothetical protein HATV-2_gp14 [Haloarcula tailed virus 2]